MGPRGVSVRLHQGIQRVGMDCQRDCGGQVFVQEDDTLWGRPLHLQHHRAHVSRPNELYRLCPQASQALRGAGGIMLRGGIHAWCPMRN